MPLFRKKYREYVAAWQWDETSAMLERLGRRGLPWRAHTAPINNTDVCHDLRIDTRNVKNQYVQRGEYIVEHADRSFSVMSETDFLETYETACTIPPKPTPRDLAYQAIDSERAYQDNLARNDFKQQTPMEHLSIIQTIVDRARDWWYDQSGQLPIDYMRKIAGVAVRCMEQHGAPRREGY